MASLNTLIFQELPKFELDSEDMGKSHRSCRQRNIILLAEQNLVLKNNYSMASADLYRSNINYLDLLIFSEFKQVAKEIFQTSRY